MAVVVARGTPAMRNLLRPSRLAYMLEVARNRVPLVRRYGQLKSLILIIVNAAV